MADWDATPESVKAVVTVLSERLAYIEEQLKQNSQNSSRPPSSDDFVKPEKKKVSRLSAIAPGKVSLSWGRKPSIRLSSKMIMKVILNIASEIGGLT